ncbi:MAG: 1-acyl-sn-glycerol-3-phosphate acyltransferase [Paludibacter sp.]
MKYKITNYLVKCALYLYYDEIIIVGAENIPSNSGFIFAPNHRNALMDALAILLLTPHNKTTSFLARSDIFKKKKVAAFLRFAKIMPAFRIRDGFENLSRNNAVFDECVDLLQNNHTLCIMPEGNQETDHKIRPLVKGIFRIAFSVQQQNKSEQSLQIVPVGLDYGSIEKFGKHLIINVGEPIQVSDYGLSYQDNPPKAINELKDHLSDSLKSIAIHIDSTDHYQTILNAIEYSSYKMLKYNSLALNSCNLFIARKQLSDKLNTLAKLDSEKIVKLSKYCEEYKSKLSKYHLQARNVDQKPNIIVLVIQLLALVAILPLAVIGLIFNMFAFFTPVLIRKMLKVEYHGFFSSIQFVLGLILFPFFYITQSIIICNLLSVTVLLVPFLLITHLLTGVLAFKYYSFIKKIVAEIRYLMLSKKHKKKLSEVQTKIHNLVLN